MLFLAAKPRTPAFPCPYSSSEERRAGPGDRGSWCSPGVTPSPPLEPFPEVKADRTCFGAILKLFYFIHELNFALSKSPLITHSLGIFFKYYEKSSTHQEFSLLLRGGRGWVLGLFLSSGEAVMKEKWWERCLEGWEDGG